MQVRQDVLSPYREMHAQSGGRRALQGTYEDALGRSAAADIPIPCLWDNADYSCTVADWLGWYAQPVLAKLGMPVSAQRRRLPGIGYLNTVGTPIQQMAGPVQTCS